jgi:hypothetical protein
MNVLHGYIIPTTKGAIMPQKLTTAIEGTRAQVFHENDKGLRGITLLRSSGHRKTCLYVTVLAPDGKRKALTSYSLKDADFRAQWARAVSKIAEYHHVNEDDPLYAEMLEAWREFLDRYHITLEPITIYQANIPTTEARA